MPEEKTMLFSQDALRKLLWPLIIEQFLAIAMGMADTVMAASCGEAGIRNLPGGQYLCAADRSVHGHGKRWCGCGSTIHGTRR